MSLIQRHNNELFCLQHQQVIPEDKLVVVWLDREGLPEQACPLCVEEMDAEFAKVVQESKNCVVHGDTTYGIHEAVGSCAACGLYFCANCLGEKNICVFCNTKTRNSA